MLKFYLNSLEYKFYLNNGHFDDRVGSEVFSVKYASVVNIGSNIVMSDASIPRESIEELDKSIYIYKLTDNDFMNIHKSCCLDHFKSIDKGCKHPVLGKYLMSLDETARLNKTIDQHCNDCGKQDLLKDVVSFEHYTTALDRNFISGNREILLNTHSRIYPSLTYADYQNKYARK